MFADVYLHNTIIAGSMGIVGLLFIYRYVASYNIVRSNIAAVSYTHLDVYKRQESDFQVAIIT